MKRSVSRRSVLAGTAATIGATTLGIITLSQDSKAAEIELGNLNIDDEEYRGEEIEALNLEVEAEYDFESSHAPDSYTIELLIGDSDSTVTAIDEVSSSDTLGKEETGTETLSGRLTETYHFATSDFEVSGDNPETTRVYIGLRFSLEKDGETIAEDEIIENVSITVDPTQLEATASIGGTGEIAIS